jgi:hypothetical protein
VAEEPDKLDRSTGAPIDRLKKSGSGCISEIVAVNEVRWSATKEARLRGDASGSKLRFVFNGRRSTEVREPASALLALVNHCGGRRGGDCRKRRSNFAPHPIRPWTPVTPGSTARMTSDVEINPI